MLSHVKSAEQKIIFLISQPKHVVGTQKNRLNETVLLSTRNIYIYVKNDGQENIYNFMHALMEKHNQICSQLT